MARIGDKNVIATMLTLTSETRYTFDGKILEKSHGGTWRIKGKRKQCLTLEQWRERVIEICKFRDDAGLTLFAQKFKDTFGKDSWKANESLKLMPNDLDGVCSELNDFNYGTQYTYDDIKEGKQARDGYLQMLAAAKPASDAMYAAFKALDSQTPRQ